ncbi:MAG TPA: F0F1 ATP synthase subunit B [Clostridiaceae bacterium]|nr:F0F1 ATP synthase subunit B [Clostridiaceae bacterium]
MFNLGPTFIWTAVNLIILYVVLRLLLFKPVTAMMEKRTNTIKSNLEEAEKAKADAAQLKQDYELQLKNAASEAERIISEARAKAEAEYEAIIKAAKEKADKIIEKSRMEIEHERQQMVKEIKNQVASLAIAAASKVLEANMDTERNREIVDRFIDKEGVA